MVTENTYSKGEKKHNKGCNGAPDQLTIVVPSMGQYLCFIFHQV